MEEGQEAQQTQEGQQTQEVQQEQQTQQTQDNRCSLCPEVQGEHGPQPETLDGAAWSNLNCGHTVHTHCLLSRCILNAIRTIDTLAFRRNIPTCPECNEIMIREDVYLYYETVFNHEQPRRTRPTTEIVKELWYKNEMFREDIKEYKKSITQYRKSFSLLKKDLKVVRTNFLENIKSSSEFIKDQQRIARQSYNRLGSKKGFTSALSKCSRLKTLLRNRYDVSMWDIHEGLRNIKGAPKFQNRWRYNYPWRLRAKHYFRVRLE